MIVDQLPGLLQAKHDIDQVGVSTLLSALGLIIVKHNLQAAIQVRLHHGHFRMNSNELLCSAQGSSSISSSPKLICEASDDLPIEWMFTKSVGWHPIQFMSYDCNETRKQSAALLASVIENNLFLDDFATVLSDLGLDSKVGFILRPNDLIAKFKEDGMVLVERNGDGPSQLVARPELVSSSDDDCIEAAWDIEGGKEPSTPVNAKCAYNCSGKNHMVKTHVTY